MPFECKYAIAILRKDSHPHYHYHMQVNHISEHQSGGPRAKEGRRDWGGGEENAHDLLEEMPGLDQSKSIPTNCNRIRYKQRCK